MVSAQNKMENHDNRNRREAEIYKPGARVWLNLKNLQTLQLSKKLLRINAKHQVVKVIDSCSVVLNTPSSIWPYFHVDLLKRAGTDPLPSQSIADLQPSPIVPGSLQKSQRQRNNSEQEPEQYVEKILLSENKKVGRGHGRYLSVNWKGFAELTWKRRSNMNETEALDKFEKDYGTGDGVGEAMDL